MIIIERYKIDKSKINSIDSTKEEIAKRYLEEIQGIKLTKNQPKLIGNKGVPDFHYRIRNKYFYVEIKCDEDHLRRSQLNWIFDNQEKNIRICLFDIPKKKPIKKSKEEIEELMESMIEPTEPKNLKYKEVYDFIKKTDNATTKSTISEFESKYDDTEKIIEQLKRAGYCFVHKGVLKII